MNRILKSSIIINLIIFSIIGFLTFSYYQGYSIIKEAQIIDIYQDPENEITNKQYIEILKTEASNSNIELIYMHKTIENNITNLNYYTTNNLNTYTDYTEKLTKNNLMPYPSVFTQSTINLFDEIDKYTLSELQLYVVGDDEDIYQFTQEMNKNGYKCEQVISDQIYLVPLKTFNMKMIIFLLLLVTFFIFLFYQISKSKKMMLRKLNGYSLMDSIKEDLVKFNNFLFKILLLIIMLTIILFIGEITNYIYYLPFLLIFNIKFFLVVNLFYIITLLIIYNNISIKSLKNNISNKGFSLFIHLFKLGLLIILIITVSKLPKEFHNYVVTKDEYKQIEGTIDYSYLNTYTTTLVSDPQIEEKISENMNDQMKNLYYLTVDDLEGILGYFLIPENDDDDFEDVPLQAKIPHGVINANYLSYNPIYDIDGNKINVDQLPDDKITYLVPQKYQSDQDVENYLMMNSQNYCDNQCINIIYVEDNSQYQLISDDLIKLNDNQYIIDPIVSIVNQDSVEEINQFGAYGINFSAYISSHSYIVKTNQENPYDIVQPYMQEAGLEKTIIEAPLITSSKLNDFIYTKKVLVSTIMFISIALVGILISSYYLIKTTININSKKYSLSVMSGEKTNRIIKLEYLKLIITYTLLFIFGLYLETLSNQIILGGQVKLDQINVISNISIIIIAIIIVIEIILYLLIFNNDIIKQLNKNIKGGR